MPFYIGVPEKKDNGYTVVWDASFDFKGEDITYTFELAKDYNFKNVIVKQTDLEIPTTSFDKLPKGQYFMRVKARTKVEKLSMRLTIIFWKKVKFTEQKVSMSIKTEI